MQPLRPMVPAMLSPIDRDSLLARVRELGMHSEHEFLTQAFARNLGLLSEMDQRRLWNATIAIPGMGGVGGVHLLTMVRTGAGRFHLSDFDRYEPVNVNRQVGATVPNFGRPKLDVMMEQALAINPYVRLTPFSEGIHEENLDDFLDGVDVVLDGLDFFSFETRRLLFNRARQRGIHVITAGPLGFSSALLIFAPDEGMSFDEYFHIVEGMTEAEQALAFALGLAPRPTHLRYMDLSRVDLESKKGPSLDIACQICSGMAATEAVRIILGKGKVRPVPFFSQFDPYTQTYRKGRLTLGNRNPLQRIKAATVKVILRRKNGSPNRPTPPVRPRSSPVGPALSDETVHYLIRAGIQAPSGDNAQPWRFSHKGRQIFVHLDRDADRSFFNIRQVASIISCGAVLENIRVAATSLDMDATVQTSLDPNSDVMGSVKLTGCRRDPDPLVDALWKRKTNRRFYDGKPVPPSALRDLRDSIGDIPGTKLHLVTESSRLRKVASLVRQVDRIRAEHRGLHEYLHHMIRYTEKEAKEKHDGLPLKNLEAGVAGELFLRATRRWRVMQAANRVGLGRMVALHAYQGLLRSSGAALLTVDGTSVESFVRGGQALERVWLTATNNGLSVQPMTAITLFWLRWQLEGAESFAPVHRDLLRRVWGSYRGLFPGLHFGSEGQVMLLRFGYGEDISCPTFRKPLDSFWEGSASEGPSAGTSVAVSSPLQRSENVPQRTAEGRNLARAEQSR